MAHGLNNMMLKMWHDDNSFDGEVVFNMELFNDWYSDTEPLEIVNSLAPGFDSKKPHLLINQDNVAFSLNDQEFIEHMFKIRESLIHGY